MTSVELSGLPEGQRRAMDALIGGRSDRTYGEAAEVAGISLGTMLTHVNRVRQNHPDVYGEVRVVRRQQLEGRHARAMNTAEWHSAMYFRRRKRWMLRILGFSL